MWAWFSYHDHDSATPLYWPVGYTHMPWRSIDAKGADLLIQWTNFSATIVSVECHGDKIVLEDKLKSSFLDKLNYKRMKRKDWDVMFFKWWKFV